jgi:hypothetical protein
LHIEERLRPASEIEQRIGHEFAVAHPRLWL